MLTLCEGTMDFVGKAIYYFGIIAALVGVITAIFPLFGLRRIDGLLSILLGSVFVFLGPELSAPLKAELAAETAEHNKIAKIARANEAALNPVQLTRQEMLANLRIDSFSWEKEGFGS